MRAVSVVLILMLSATLFAEETKSSKKPESASWPLRNFDAQCTSFNPHERTIGPSNVGDLEVLWTNSFSSTVRYFVSVVDGVAYYGLYGGEFRAVDAATGTRLWTKSLSGKHTGHAIMGRVAYATSIKKLYAFDAATGAELWTWDIGTTDVTGLMAVEGVLYLNAAGRHHALDARTGKELWSVSAGGKAAVDGGVVYMTKPVRAVDATNGKVIWTGGTEEGKLSALAVADGVVYAHSNAGYLYAFDASRGGQESRSPLWTAVTQVQSGTEGPQAPAVAYKKVYVGAGDTLYAFDAHAGEAPKPTPVWTAPTDCSFFPPAGVRRPRQPLCGCEHDLAVFHGLVPV